MKLHNIMLLYFLDGVWLANPRSTTDNNTKLHCYTTTYQALLPWIAMWSHHFHSSPQEIL